MGGIISHYNNNSLYSSSEHLVGEEDLTKQKLDLHKSFSSSPINNAVATSSMRFKGRRGSLEPLERAYSYNNDQTGFRTEPSDDNADTPLHAATKKWATAHGNRNFFVDDLITAISPTANDSGINPLKTPTLVLATDNTFVSDTTVDASFGDSSQGLSSSDSLRGLNIYPGEKRTSIMNEKPWLSPPQSARVYVRKPLRLQDFDFIREICQGSFATVVLGNRQGPPSAYHPSNTQQRKEPYALKVFQKTRIDELNMHHHIIRELSVMAYTNQYPHLFPQLYGCFLSQSYYNIVMEYIPGGDCLTALLEMNRFPEHVARILIAEVAVAIKTLHDHCVVHRDIKSDNIMITSTGHAKLIDFTLAFTCPTLLRRSASTQSSCVPSPRVISALPSGDNANMFSLPQQPKGPHDPWILSSTDLSNSQPIARPVTAQAAKFAGVPRQLSGLSISSAGSSVVFTRNTNTSNAITSSTTAPKEGGNYLYSSPEILLGDEYDYMVDWWGFGVLLFHFISGITPFAVASAPHNPAAYDICETVNNIISQKIVNWHAVPSNTSSDCRDLISSLLSEPFPKRLGYDSCQHILDHKYFQGLGIDSQSQTASNEEMKVEFKSVSAIPGESLYSQPGPLRLIPIGKPDDSRYVAVPRDAVDVRTSNFVHESVEGSGARSQAALAINNPSLITISMLQRDAMSRLDSSSPISAHNSTIPSAAPSPKAAVDPSSSFKGKMGWLPVGVATMQSSRNPSNGSHNTSSSGVPRLPGSSNMTQHQQDVALAFHSIDSKLPPW